MRREHTVQLVPHKQLLRHSTAHKHVTLPTVSLSGCVNGVLFIDVDRFRVVDLARHKSRSQIPTV